ncbi:hypothetical protein E2C01_089568 [Portunus trituberculatus]|uniref:Uncharacterized protein n=1 Tax=Portunus trituberculatus TaxID=210409 RepID=A0A5B7JCD4_PORTR|nr:hypothetical protein [Portunus trituberculatus]
MVLEGPGGSWRVLEDREGFVSRKTPLVKIIDIRVNPADALRPFSQRYLRNKVFETSAARWLIQIKGLEKKKVIHGN